DLLRLGPCLLLLPAAMNPHLGAVFHHELPRLEESCGQLWAGRQLAQPLRFGISGGACCFVFVLAHECALDAVVVDEGLEVVVGKHCYSLVCSITSQKSR